MATPVDPALVIAEKRRQALAKRCQLLLDRCLVACQERSRVGALARPHLRGWLSEQDGLVCVQLSVSEPQPAHLSEVLKHLSIDSFSVDSAGLLVKFADASWNSSCRCWELPLRPCCVYEASWERRLREFFPDAVQIALPPTSIVEELLQLDQSDERGVGPAAEPRLSSVPRALRATLRPFQMEAVEFAIRRDGRVLLADEMGLGKTLQALAIAASFSDDSWPALVLCPTSVREVWVEMLERWIPELQPRELCVLRRRFDSR